MSFIFIETKRKSELLKAAPRYGNMTALDGVKMSTIHRKILPLDHKEPLLILSCYMNINNIPRYIYIYINSNGRRQCSQLQNFNVRQEKKIKSYKQSSRDNLTIWYIQIILTLILLLSFPEYFKVRTVHNR